MNILRINLACLTFGLILLATTVVAEPPESGLPNVKLPTLGAKQLWADELHFHGWRIQRNVVTSHCRLLDAKDIRHTWGSYDACKKKLDAIRREQKLPAMKGKAVIVIHGLGRTRSAMKKLARYMQNEGGYTIFSISYPSTREDIATHARRLAGIVENLEGIEEINFVGHSLGNIVLRHYLGDQTDEKTGRKPDKRIRRVVMLAPPNQGAQLGKRLGDLPLYRTILGSTGEAFSKNWKQLEPHLATPGCDFGIMAGGRGDAKGFNPLIQGDDDLVVSVATTKLAGARDFRVLPVHHTFIMDDPNVHRYTLDFFKHGWFESDEKRQSIEK
jgi:pimeloyl-ACP methyl ester carboxylesterase